MSSQSSYYFIIIQSKHNSFTVWNRSRLTFTEHRLPDLKTQRPAHGRRHGIPDLSVTVSNCPRELVAVGESLAPGQFPDGQNPVLLWVKDLALLAQGLGVGDRGLEISIPGGATIHLLPVVMSVRSVRD